MLETLKNLAQIITNNKLFRFCYTSFSKIYFPIVSSNIITTKLHYFLFSQAFNREMRGVLKGHKKYFSDLQKNPYSNVALRRNIHRLEKGLLMRPRRKVFALNYIEETVEAFTKATQKSKQSSETKWAFDVLTNFFKVIDLSNPKLKKTHQKFKNASQKIKESKNEKFIPYQRDLKESSTSYDEFLQLCLKRRSVRWYSDKKVPHKLIDKAIKAANLSPSACNRQPFEIRIFDDPKLVKKISKIPFGTGGYSDNIPVICVIIGKLESYFSPRDRHLIYIDGSLFSMSFMLALETLGLSSCPINWPDFGPLEHKMARALELKPNERPLMLISLGYPLKEGLVAYSQKKDLDDIRSYNA